MDKTRTSPVKAWAVMIAGAMLMGLSYELFIFPNAFAPAGFHGIATMVQYLFNISIGYFSALINLPLLLIAWKRVDRIFTIRTAVFVLVFSITTLILNSLVSFVIMLLYIPIIVMRILDEEKVLKEELKGYREYTEKVRYRLLPLIW